jgi:mannose-6-phosphate isomerase-like protein (cupin superfamily)
MNLKIKPSKLDDKKISEMKVTSNNNLNKFDFSKVVVKKPWGREYLAYTGKETDIWVLYLNKGAATSMHSHSNKKTSLIVLGGNVICSTLDKDYSLKEGDVIFLEKKVFHSTKATSEKGALVMELESPPNKTDLIRLKDNYGRENLGYESQSDMCFDLSEYERVFLHESDLHRKIGNMSISIVNFNEILILKDYLKLNRNFINLLIAGELQDKDNGKISEIGSILDISNFKKNINTRITKPIKIISIQRNIFDSD